jgi:hypothetical protein
VRRGSEPEWYQDAVNLNTGPTNMSWALSKKRIVDLGIHASETAWVGTDFDHVLDNNSTLDELYNQVKHQVLDRHDAMVDLI